MVCRLAYLMLAILLSAVPSAVASSPQNRPFDHNGINCVHGKTEGDGPVEVSQEDGLTVFVGAPTATFAVLKDLVGPAATATAAGLPGGPYSGAGVVVDHKDCEVLPGSSQAAPAAASPPCIIRPKTTDTEPVTVTTAPPSVFVGVAVPSFVAAGGPGYTGAGFVVDC